MNDRIAIPVNVTILLECKSEAVKRAIETISEIIGLMPKPENPAEQPELNLEMKETEPKKAIRFPAKQEISVMFEGSTSFTSFKSKSSLFNFCGVKQIWLDHTDRFKDEKDMILAEAKLISDYLKRNGKPIKKYSRYFSQQNGGKLITINIEELN